MKMREIILHRVKMLKNSISKCKNTQFRRYLWSLVVFLVIGTLIIHSTTLKVSWPLNLWTVTSGSNNSHDHVTTSFDRVSPSPPTHYSLQYTVAYPHKYRFILDEPNRCRQESPFLVLIIPTEPHNREARDIIRNTWGNQTRVLDKVVSYYFILGLSKRGNGAEHVEEQLLHESQNHHDILQSDFLDSYNNLTIKTMLMFEWLSSHCPNTFYAMKTDSDVFLNVHNLVSMLLKAPRHLYMTGNVVRGSYVLRDQSSKWFLPVSVFPEPTYPPYVLGLGYVFSLDLPSKILEASAHVRAVYIEDVYVGLCMRHLGIAVTDPPRGDLFRPWKPFFAGNCYWTFVIATLLQSSEQILDVWETYRTQAQSGC